MNTSTQDLQRQAAFLDAQDIARDLNREFVDADLVQFKTHGVDLVEAAVYFVEKYAGKAAFVLNMKKRVAPMTQPQARVCLNVMRHELLGTASWNSSLTTTSGEVHPRSARSVECFTCHEQFPTWDALNAHKKAAHGTAAPPKVFTDKGEAKDVLEVNTSTIGLDLSNLPDGRYAAPDVTGKNDYIFLVVKRVRKTVRRDRRYTYGKYVTGNEIVVAGTIEVRIWSSDTKEWVGQQKPGDVYRGKYEDELKLIMMMPQAWAILFGKLLHYCGRCGKKLTDEVSRSIGLGLDCERIVDWSKPKYTYVGTDRPNPQLANPYDDKYLKGEWRRWVDPPKVTVALKEVDEEGDDDDA